MAFLTQATIIPKITTPRRAKQVVKLLTQVQTNTQEKTSTLGGIKHLLITEEKLVMFYNHRVISSLPHSLPNFLISYLFDVYYYLGYRLVKCMKYSFYITTTPLHY